MLIDTSFVVGGLFGVILLPAVITTSLYISLVAVAGIRKIWPYAIGRKD